MKLFAPADEIGDEPLDLQCGASEGCIHQALERAWYLRQSDTAESARYLAWLEHECLPNAAHHEASSQLVGRTTLIRAEAKWLDAELEEAAALATRALEVFTAAQDILGQADSRWQLGLIRGNQGDLAGREALVSAAIDLATKSGDEDRALHFRAHQARLVAMQSIEKSDMLWPRSDDALATGRSLYVKPMVAVLQGVRDYLAGNYSLGIVQIERAHTGFVQTGQMVSAITAAVNIAGIYEVLNDYSAAFEALERALQLARPAGWKSMLGAVLRQRASMLCAMGHHENARDAENEARACLAGMQRTRNYAYLLVVSGRISHQVGELQSATESFKQAATLLRELEQPDALIEALLAAARAQLDAKELDAAQALVQEAMQTANASQVHLLQSQALRLLSQVALAQGNTSQAQKHRQAALEHSEAISGYLIPPELLLELADGYAEDGQFEPAYMMAKRAFDARIKVQSKEATDRATALQVRIAAERERTEAEYQKEIARVEAKRSKDLEAVNAQLESMAQALRTKNLELDLLSKTDRLTGLANRTRLDAVLEEECARNQRSGEPLSVILLDIDNFKSVNDKFGHQVGDIVLVAVAGILKTNVRPYDVVGRWGGEEFLVVCNTNIDNAALIAEKLRFALEAHQIDIVGPKTGSFGVASILPGESIESVLGRADAALYRAKGGGRNRVEVALAEC